jgi:hypothetical protein
MPIRNAWNKLGSTADEPVAGLLVLRLCPESKLDVFAAIDPQSNRRLLLLKSKVPPIRRLENLPEGLGFRLQFVETLGDVDGIHSLRFELTDFAYADVFDVVANDVLENIIRCNDSVEAFDAFAGRIAEWQAFLNTLPSTGLSEQHQLGLFAELKFLRDILLETCGAEEAVAAWAGPKALAKDFQFPKFAFEVKATTTKEPTRFRISNEVQLESPKDGRLFIFGCIFERVLSGGESLPGVVKALRDLLRPSGLASARFSQLLLQSGYLDIHTEHYDSQFKTRSQYFFEVRYDFPRIIGADLRRGVGDVHYSIQLSDCRRFEISDAEIRGMLGETKK